MNRLIRRFLPVLAGSLILPLVAISASLADIVTLTADATTKGGANGLIRGTVVSESPTKVEVKLGNTVTPIPTNEIVSIAYDNAPSSLEAARKAEAENSLAAAADLYKKLRPKPQPSHSSPRTPRSASSG